jgi:hypothetical protein
MEKSTRALDVLEYIFNLNFCCNAKTITSFEFVKNFDDHMQFDQVPSWRNNRPI